VTALTWAKTCDLGWLYGSQGDSEVPKRQVGNTPNLAFLSSEAFEAARNRPRADQRCRRRVLDSPGRFFQRSAESVIAHSQRRGAAGSLSLVLTNCHRPERKMREPSLKNVDRSSPDVNRNVTS
jgi:hypothetical protein